ncbi:MAG TPA: LPS-assembly protein LptD, partial [Paracoccaceae bacterium]|nr:LPS-assembly protein LptD [Paracoccaceae bacterium]
NWTRQAATGWSLGVTMGRILRDGADNRFSTASGLAGTSSDWLAAVRLETDAGVALTNRLILDDGGALTKAELRLDLESDRVDLSSAFIWMQADPAEARDADVRELAFDGRYAFTPALSGRLATRYDFETGRAASAGLKVEYRNECLKVDLSLSRRFTSSTSVKPVTDFGLSVELLGFGGQSRPGPSRLCRG